MFEKLFLRNEHGVDRGLRIVLGLAALSLVFLGPQTLWGLLGLIPLATGLAGTCPMYTLLGVGTCKVKPKEPKLETMPSHGPAC